ncbi:MAG: hypothetical protein IPG04_15245 [Polyangiaceae bacterium]|nr:hypothetical protein [Polyangiaceae bacterium]
MKGALSDHLAAPGTRSLGLDEVERAEIVSAGELRDRYGLGMRIGAGGLWGGFGLLAFRSVTFAMYVSRSDRFVLVWLRGQRPLMVTPDDPEVFVAPWAADAESGRPNRVRARGMGSTGARSEATVPC